MFGALDRVESPERRLLFQTTSNANFNSMTNFRWLNSLGDVVGSGVVRETYNKRLCVEPLYVVPSSVSFSSPCRTLRSNVAQNVLTWNFDGNV